MSVDLYAQLVPTPPDLIKKAFSLLSKVRDTGGKINRGIYGTTRAVKSGNAKLVYIVSDLEYPEQVLHLKVLCEEKNIPYVCVPEYRKYGVVDSAAVIDVGKARRGFNSFIVELNFRMRLI